MLLAAHLERAGEPRGAVAWYHKAAEQALEGNDFAAAVERAAHGIRCGATGPLEGALRLTAAEAHRWRGENLDTLREAQAAMRCFPAGEPQWCSAVATCALTAGKVADRRVLAEMAGLVLGLERSGPLAEAIARLYTSLLLLGLPDEAAALAPALELDAGERAHFGPEVGARVDVARSVAAMSAGDVVAYLRLSEAAVAGYEAAGDRRGALGPRVNVGFALIELGLYAEAVRTLREALEGARRLNVPSVIGSALQNLGWALAGEGVLDEALAVEEEAAALYHAQGARYCEGSARLYLGRILGARGDRDGAELQLIRAVNILAVAPPMQRYAQAALARTLLDGGKREPALELAREAAASPALSELSEGEALVRLTLAEALAAAGLDDEARAARTEARERLLARAAKISDPDLRARFLDVVPENAATLRD